MKTKLFMMAMGTLTLFGLCSCLQVESTITLKKDGSGTITEEVILGDTMLQTIANMQAEAEQVAGLDNDPITQMMDKEKAKARAKEMGEGVEFVSFEKIDADGQPGVKTVFKFSDINKLRYDFTEAMGDAVGKAEKKEGGADNIPTFKYADGKLAIIQAQSKDEVAEAEGANPDLKIDDEGKAFMANMEKSANDMMKAMMKDMRIVFKMKFEPGIAKTNATYVDGDTITLTDVTIGKVLDNAEKFKALQSGDLEKMKKAVKGIDGIKIEINETVEVELK